MGERNPSATGDRGVARREKTGGFGAVPLGFATDAPCGGTGSLTGGRCATRTRDLWFRRPTLYPPELIAHAIIECVAALRGEVNTEIGVSHGERRKDISKVKPKSIWIPAPRLRGDRLRGNDGKGIGKGNEKKRMGKRQAKGTLRFLAPNKSGARNDSARQHHAHGERRSPPTRGGQASIPI